VDVGPDTVKLFSAEIASAKTVVWNGPMGVFEIKDCAKGTFAIAEAIAANSGCKSIIGGGDSVKAVKRAWRSRQGDVHLHRWRREPRASGGKNSPLVSQRSTISSTPVFVVAF
jgi:hypothetical protein